MGLHALRRVMPFFWFVTLSAGTLCFAQNNAIGGSVRDSNSKSPVGDVEVTIVGTKTQIRDVTRRDDGVYVLTAPTASSTVKLLFKHVCYANTSKTISNQQPQQKIDIVPLTPICEASLRNVSDEAIAQIIKESKEMSLAGQSAGEKELVEAGQENLDKFIKASEELRKMAESLSEGGNPTGADALFVKAVGIQTRILGTTDPLVANSLESYAAALRKANRNQEAADVARRASAIREQNLAIIKNLQELPSITGKTLPVFPNTIQFGKVEINVGAVNSFVLQTVGKGEPCITIFENQPGSAVRIEITDQAGRTIPSYSTITSSGRLRRCISAGPGTYTIGLAGNPNSKQSSIGVTIQNE